MQVGSYEHSFSELYPWFLSDVGCFPLPRHLRGHSREDMEAKHDALTAHTSHVRQLYKNAKKDHLNSQPRISTSQLYIALQMLQPSIIL